MATITKKELIDRIADQTGQRRVQVKRVVQQFLDEVISELGQGNRLEFRDFGVFETKVRKARRAQNPKTLEPVSVPEKRTVKFKVGRLMKQKLAAATGAVMASPPREWLRGARRPRSQPHPGWLPEGQGARKSPLPSLGSGPGAGWLVPPGSLRSAKRGGAELPPAAGRRGR